MTNFEPISNCPCCGAKAEKVHIIPWEPDEREQDKVGVRCTSCPLAMLLEGDMYIRVDERAEFVIEMWNTRTP